LLVCYNAESFPENCNISNIVLIIQI